jgi:ribosomal protein L5
MASVLPNVPRVSHAERSLQAEQKTTPTNPMKELRIEKLVISTFTSAFPVGRLDEPES